MLFKHATLCRKPLPTKGYLTHMLTLPSLAGLLWIATQLTACPRSSAAGQRHTEVTKSLEKEDSHPSLPRRGCFISTHHSGGRGTGTI